MSNEYCQQETHTFRGPSRECQRKTELMWFFQKMEGNMDSRRREVRESFPKKETHVRRAIKEGKPTNEFFGVTGSICHKGRWIWMARLWPLGCRVEVPHVNPTHVSMHMTAGGSGISMVENQASKKPSGSILSLHTDEQEESPLNWTCQGQYNWFPP